MDRNTILLLIGFLIGGITEITSYLLRKRAEERTQKRVSDAESRVEKEPEKAKPAWDLARVTLESYFNKNLAQVTAIFRLCIFVMFVGFVIIVWGISQAIRSPESTIVAVVSGSAGILTELIGATFLIIYRSTMEQAMKYTETLERINSVGMAMAILDTIPDSAQEGNLKNATKATVVKLLMQQANENSEVTVANQED
ncbi:MAG: hypothetical protein JXJ17_00430 [Anaerolineae bacterium]|nr:hypothetical protein [Anaerolineae bacterium]